MRQCISINTQVSPQNFILNLAKSFFCSLANSFYHTVSSMELFFNFQIMRNVFHKTRCFSKTSFVIASRSDITCMKWCECVRAGSRAIPKHPQYHTSPLRDPGSRICSPSVPFTFHLFIHCRPFLCHRRRTGAQLFPIIFSNLLKADFEFHILPLLSPVMPFLNKSLLSPYHTHYLWL